MYKILIVDDEEIVRSGVRRKLDWAKLGFEVIGEADNGKEALAIAETENPDVILTDIRMPIMDGIELTKIINERMPYIKIVILTGHEEFEFAQKSIKLGVLDYILKPISSVELSCSMIKIKEVLDKKIDVDNEIEILKKQVMQSMPILREHFLNDLVLSKMNHKEILDKKAFFGVDLMGQAFTAMIVEIDDYQLIVEHLSEEEKQLLKFALLNAVESVVNNYEHTVTFKAKYDFLTIIYSGDNKKEKMIDKIDCLSESIKTIVNKSMGKTVSIGIGRIYESLLDIHKSFKEAKQALEYKLLVGKNSTIFISDVRSETGQHVYYPMDIEKQILMSVKLGNKDDITTYLNQMINTVLGTHHKGWTYIQIVFNQLLTAALSMIQELDADIVELMNSNENLYMLMSKYETIEDLKSWMNEFLYKISNYVTLERNSKYKSVIERAKNYIAQNFNNSEISLNKVAKHVNVSNCYFSVIFKSEVGDAFQDYLIKIRINKAKEYLRTTDMKTYEIAYEVGYNDPHYFGVSFKKNVGVTPTEYRKIKSR